MFLNQSCQVTDLVQLFFDFVVAYRLPGVVEERVLVLARLVSTLQMSLPLPSFLADFQELNLPLEKIAIAYPFVFVKIERLLLVRVAELCICTWHLCVSLILAEVLNFTWMSGSAFALIMHGISRSFVCFLSSNNWYTLRIL